MSTQIVTDSYVDELHEAIHDWSSDTFKLALFDASAALSASTTAYSTTNEISGTGYSAGGFTLAIATGFPKMESGRWLVDFDDISQDPAAFSFRYGLIYNSSKANRAVAVLDAGSLVTVSNSFSTVFPPGTTSDAILRVSK